jgi:lysophospholipase L1-like esterase
MSFLHAFIAGGGPLIRRALAVLIGAGAAFAAGACGSDGPGPTPVELRITCPQNADAQSADGGPVAVTYQQPATVGGSAPVTTTCSPQSGTMFAVGSTPVTCQARDGNNRSASCQFTVAVRPPPELRYTRYVAFGDSITWGVASVPVTSQFALLAPEPPPFHAYPNLLEQRLIAQYRRPSSPTVLNAGIGGELAADGGLRRFRNVLLTFNPEVVLLMEGTNDLLRGQAGADDAIAALDTMIGQAQALGRVACLATIPPQRLGARRPVVPLLIPAFNDRIRELAIRRNVILVDVFNAMKDDLSLIGQDDLHPTVRGFEVIADRFFAAIKANFERTPGATSVEQTP